jgi:hypothetical protein
MLRLQANQQACTICIRRNRNTVGYIAWMSTSIHNSSMVRSGIGITEGAAQHAAAIALCYG